MEFKNINSFNFHIQYIDAFPLEIVSGLDSHIHSECEIYINLSGDVSFEVENKIYPISPGDIIITRPYEYHHCIYHSNKKHKNFWILISPNGNEEFLDVFYKRKVGEKNLLTLSAQKTEELIYLCHRLTQNSSDKFESYCDYFRLLSLISSADVKKSNKKNYPADILYSLNYINEHLKDDININEIALAANVSINTLERHFKDFFGITPSKYIQKKRLVNAAKLLSQGKTVTEASNESGFPDYSGFIALFRKTYGITPLKYKKKADH